MSQKSDFLLGSTAVGPIWTNVHQIEAIWTHLDSIKANLSHVDQFGFLWSPLDQFMEFWTNSIMLEQKKLAKKCEN
jgi:hypothetical protein